MTENQGMLAFSKHDLSRRRPCSVTTQAIGNARNSALLKHTSTASYCSSQIKNEAREGFGVLTHIVTKLRLMLVEKSQEPR